jgi:hypothetical protein
MNEQLEVLKLVAQRLEQAGMAYMISGSIALSYYAEPRLTRDIDLVVELRAGDAERFTDLFAADFYIDPEAIRDAIARSGMFNLIHYESVMKVDVIVRKDTPYRREEFLRRSAADVEGMTLWFVSAEDLLLSKLVWAEESRSEMQLQDVRNLITAVTTLDWAYIEHWAAELAVADLLREVRG